MIDFLIIGGGVAGLSAAARLSTLGSVTVLEREDALAYHASGRSAALFEEHYGKPSTVALNRASLDFHRSADVLSPRGLMLIGSAAEADLFAADVQAMRMTEITMDEALALIPVLNPDHVDRAAYDPGAWDIDTDRLIQTFAKTARGNGAQIVTKAEVTGISRTAQGWAVSTKGGEFEARQLVNAAGAWVDVIAAMAGVAPLGFQPLRRSMARIPAPDGHDVRAWPMVFGAGEGWYAKPDAGALIVSPAEEDPTDPHDAYADDMVLAEGLARYEANVTTPVTRLLASWAGLRTFAPDRTLVLGPDPAHPGFIWCAGQGGYGMQSSPGASQLLADLISGNTPAISPDMVAALAPDRLR
ncbi:NAD(P)/FAD-dependent oxidoreductase [Yoonia vestfoldensis]|uniref:NAD(P)/FAD-dependent oxidoreductase n=1 Tax=Yoonia vestfoldensis TaxID=245188 RepID=UPI0003826F8E|nr:FAD-dependent oxidoreductase [Yoonia vestfoldensis]